MCEFDVTKLSIYELNSLINDLQNRFPINIDLDKGVSLLNENISEQEQLNKSKYKVILSSVPSEKKISVLKTVKTLLNLGLKEAKDLIEKAPSTIKQDIFLDEANDIKSQLENAGGTVIIEKTII